MAQARKITAQQPSRMRLHLDLAFALPMLALISFGYLMVLSASMPQAEALGLPPTYYANRQLMFLVLGLVAAALTLVIPMRHWEQLSPWALVLGLILLLLVFVPMLGVRLNGARRWINLGVSYFQVVEAARLALIVYLAGYLTRRAQQAQSMAGSVKPLLIAGLAAALLLAQPDFGSAVLILAVFGTMVWLAGARWIHLTGLLLAVIPVVVLLAFQEEYRMRRLVTFLDPWADPFNNGFQLTQALIAIGRGEIWGVGLGASLQKLHYLPMAHTDFIVSVIAEELGLVGLVALLTGFALLLYRGFQIGLTALRREAYFSGWLCFGLCTAMAYQVLISFGVNLGVLPTKGLTLPLISAGGSSLLMSMVAMALILRVAHENHYAEAN